MALASPLQVGVVGEVWAVDTCFGVGSKRVCYQISQARVNDEDSRVGPKEQVGICAVRLEGRFGTDNDS
jgi:hypothetical protein